MLKRILFFGDAVGKPARKALNLILPELRQKYRPDFVVANIENLAHGKGVTMATIREIADLAIDVYTSGNHVFSKQDMSAEVFRNYPNIIRPANYLGEYPGKGYYRVEKDGQGYLVINLNGTVYFDKQFPAGVGNPFTEFDTIIAQHKKAGDIVIVDFHAEVSSEKKAFGFYADGRASLVCGTHTHTPTADLRILPKGTCHVSDVGMIGAVNSVLGVTVEASLSLFLENKWSYQLEESNPIMINAVYAEIENGLAVKTEKIYKEVNV